MFKTGESCEAAFGAQEFAGEGTDLQTLLTMLALFQFFHQTMNRPGRIELPLPLQVLHKGCFERGDKGFLAKSAFFDRKLTRVILQIVTDPNGHSATLPQISTSLPLAHHSFLDLEKPVTVRKLVDPFQQTEKELNLTGKREAQQISSGEEFNNFDVYSEVEWRRVVQDEQGDVGMDDSRSLPILLDCGFLGQGDFES